MSSSAMEYLTLYRPAIASRIGDLVEHAATHLDGVTSWAPDLRARLVEFATRGKLIRGSLVAVGAELFGHQADDIVYTVAAAVELIQSFLLIHDDIMDEDHVRRGGPAVFEQYRQLGTEFGYAQARRFGESMAICGGDVAVLVAVDAVAAVTADPRLVIDLVRVITTEIADVGVAQMADVANGHRPEAASEEEILSVYRWKTGRYTFSLPLSLGAIIAGASEDERKALAGWGELQGVIFQIRDDELGIMEDGDSTGKPAGSDIAGNKKTLHRLRLLDAVPGTRWERVSDYFGTEISPEQLAEIREALRESGVLRSIAHYVDSLDARACDLLDAIPSLDAPARSRLESIAEFNRSRRA